MGLLRDFPLNIPERQLNILWVLAHKPESLFGAAYYVTSLRTIPSKKDLVVLVSRSPPVPFLIGFS
jgi:hypothetical protein